MEVLCEVIARKQEMTSRDQKTFVQLIEIDIIHVCMVWTKFFPFFFELVMEWSELA